MNPNSKRSLFSCDFVRFGWILLFVLISFKIDAQDLFRLVRSNDHESVNSWNDLVNLRDTNNATPLMWAAYSADLDMVKLLVKKGGDIRQKGWILFKDTVTNYEMIYGSMMAIAAGENKMDLMKYLLRKHNIPIEDKEINFYENKENGWTALQWAVVKGNNDMVRYLVKHRADINAPAETDMNQTPLILAINFNRVATAKLLVELGADVNIKDDFGAAPLNYAFLTKNRELVRFLVDNDAKIPGVGAETFRKLLEEHFGVTNMDDL
jgi:ankyrin repeat protein